MAAPKTANITITVGNKDIIINRNNFSSLSIKRTARDVCDSFTLNVFDDDAYKIEAELLAGNNDVKITYIDDKEKIFKELTGYAIKLSSSYIDNRCMLRITGFVGVTVVDKYEKYSFAWNKVPKFNWGEVMGYDSLSMQWDELGFFDKLSEGWSAKLPLRFLFSNDYNFNYVTVLNNIFQKDQFSMDSNGNYYVQSYADEKNPKQPSVATSGRMTQEEENSLFIKAEGNFIIPMKPHKILKLICCGGYFSDLLEEEYSDYKGTDFYASNIREADWYYIQMWFRRMGKFEGIGYKIFEFDGDTDWSEQDFSQNRQSFMEYMYNTVLPKCCKTIDGKKYANFYLSFEILGLVRFKRLDTSVVPANIPQYIYYGKFNKKDDATNKGYMISFSPTFDILTAMITSGTRSAQSADISRVNLITGNEENTTTSSGNTNSTEGRYVINKNFIKIVPTVTTGANKTQGEIDIAKLFQNAASYAYKAEATISGFNKLCPQDYIEIIVIPKNDQGVPSYHHASGVYFILEIEDEISDGLYTSNLTLIKNVGSMGNTAAISEGLAEGNLELKYKIYDNSSANTSKGGGGGGSFGGGGFSGGGSR